MESIRDVAGPAHKRGLDSADSTVLSNIIGAEGGISSEKPPKKKKKSKQLNSTIEMSLLATNLPLASTEEDSASPTTEGGPVAERTDPPGDDQTMVDTITPESTTKKKRKNKNKKNKKKKGKSKGGDEVAGKQGREESQDPAMDIGQTNRDGIEPGPSKLSAASSSKASEPGGIARMIREGKPPPKKQPRGTRGGSKAGGKEKKKRRQQMAYRVQKARETLVILKELGRSLTDRELHEMQNREILKLVEGHRLTCGANEVIHSFDVTDFARKWREKNSLQPDAQIFQDGAVTIQDLIKYGFQIYDRGQVYGYERDNNGEMVLVFSAVFRPFATMQPELLDRFRWLAGWFTSLKSQLKPNTMNTAHQATGGVGIMLAQGWRAGMDAGMSFGWYANPRTDWLEDAKNHGVAAQLYDDLYKAQAPCEHAYAHKIIQEHGLPSFGNASATGEAASTGSNLTITCGDFCNAAHRDNDESSFTFGIWFPTTSDGKLVTDDDEAWSMVEGGHFFWADYGFAVDFGRFAGVVSLTWRGPKDRHATAVSSTKDGYLRWGTSIQIPRTLVTRVKRFQSLGGEINDFYRRSGKTPPPGYINTLKLTRLRPRCSTNQAADNNLNAADLEENQEDDYQKYEDDDDDDDDYEDLDDEDFEPFSEVESDD